MSLEQFLWMLIISALPVAELRVSLPLALLESEVPWRFVFSVPLALLESKVPWYFAFPVCFAGNLLPVPFLLLLLEPVVRMASKVKPFKRILDWVFARTRRQGRLVEKYERIGLVLVVAIPLPGTGAWTGSILAFLLGLKFKSAFVSIVIGVFIAGVIVTSLSLLGWIGGVIAGIAIMTLAILGLLRV